MSKLKTLTNGFIKENPALVLLLGACPTLAVTTSVQNAIGMGAAATFVLVGSNIIISMLKKVIPDKVRIPSYIVIIAGLVTIVQLFLQAFYQPIYKALGIFLPLIVVNCIILGRAEMFASKNKVVDSALDGIGMGIGFTLALLVMASLREILGQGTWFGLSVVPASVDPMAIFKLAPGGFFAYGIVVAAVGALSKGRGVKAKAGCGACPSAGLCGDAEKGEC